MLLNGPLQARVAAGTWLRFGWLAIPRPRGLALVIAGLALAALVSLLYLNQTSELAATTYDIADLQSQQARWELRNEQLHFAIAREESLDRIDQEATARLNLGPPRRVAFVQAPRPDIPTPGPPAPTGSSGGLPARLLDAANRLFSHVGLE
jgi:hypothetical protein